MICSDLSSLLIFNISDLLSSLEMSIRQKLRNAILLWASSRSCLGSFLLFDPLGYFL